jgi:hypothetical protein
MGLDRIDYANRGITELGKLTPKASRFLDELELATGVPIEFGGTGFGTFDAVLFGEHLAKGQLFRTELSHA